METDVQSFMDYFIISRLLIKIADRLLMEVVYNLLMVMSFNLFSFWWSLLWVHRPFEIWIVQVSSQRATSWVLACELWFEL